MSNRGINDIELRELITDPAFESGVGNVYVKQDGHLWYQEPNGTKHKITPLPTGGGGSGPMNSIQFTSDTVVTIGNQANQTVLGTVTITPQRSDSYIMLFAIANARKDVGVNNRRFVTTFINRQGVGMVSQVCTQQSQNASGTELAPNVNQSHDLSGGTSPITYELIAYSNVNALVDMTNYSLLAVELVGAQGEQGPAGLIQSIVAGSNITVDNSDPANPIVSASGGGGGGLTNFTESTGSFGSNTYVALEPNNADANVDVVLAKKGNGAISVRKPDGTAAGGNARGNNAVDLQSISVVNSWIASGNSSVITGGDNNRATGQYSVVSGGQFNNAGDISSTVSGGQFNNATGFISNVGGGKSNTSSGSASTVSGGDSNTAQAYGEWLGGIFTTIISPFSSGGYNNLDRIFGIGNGTSTSARSSALNIFKGGVGSAKTYINPGNDTTVPTADVQVGGTKGLILPRGTTAQRNSTPTQGEMRFNTDTNKFEGWTGSAWVDFH